MLAMGSPTSVRTSSSCSALLRELQQIWNDIGESEVDKDRTLLELERECLQVYRRKVDEAVNAKARLHQSVAAKEAELATLMAALGELNGHSPIGQGCRPVVKGLGMQGSVKALGRGYEYIMGVVIFVPIAVLAWFPFVTEFQTKLLFNQAFSRGLQIQRILAGGNKQKQK